MARGWGICPSNGSYMWGIWTAFRTRGRGIWPLKIKKIQMPGGVPGGGMLMLQIDRCITLSNQIGHPQIRVNCVDVEHESQRNIGASPSYKEMYGDSNDRTISESLPWNYGGFGSLMVALTAWNQQQEHKRPPFYRQDMFILNFLANKYSDMLRLLKSSYVYL